MGRRIGYQGARCADQDRFLPAHQYDGRGTAFDAIVLVETPVPPPARPLPHPYLHFYSTAIFNPLGILEGQLAEG